MRLNPVIVTPDPVVVHMGLAFGIAKPNLSGNLSRVGAFTTASARSATRLIPQEPLSLADGAVRRLEPNVPITPK